MRNGATIESVVVTPSEELISRHPGDFLSGDQPLPDRVFRYNSEIAHQELLRGRIRVGTLDGFRAMEDSSRGDKTDSTYTASSDLTRTSEPRLLAPSLQRSFGLDVRVPVHVDGTAHVQWHEQLPNALAYCASERLSRSAAGEYTHCAEILDYLLFARIVGEHVEAYYRDLAVQRALALIRVYSLVGRVEYGDVSSSSPGDTSQLTGLRKKRDFSYEAELRACWFGITTETVLAPDRAYLAIEDHRLAELVRQVDISESD